MKNGPGVASTWGVTQMAALWSPDIAVPALAAAARHRLKTEHVPNGDAPPRLPERRERAQEAPGREAPAAVPATVPVLRAHLLGSFQVEVLGCPLERWETRKGLAVLKYLVSHRRHKVPKEVLMEMLWPESDPEAARLSLKVAVSALRRSLSSAAPSSHGGSWVVSAGETYQLQPGLSVWLDTEEFEAEFQRGLQLEREHRVEECVRSYRQAIALYQGDFLEEDPYEEWTVLERERLRDLYLEGLARLSRNLIRMREWNECIGDLHKILAIDPHHEEAYEMLSMCHTQLGQLGRVRQLRGVREKVIRGEGDAA